MSRIRTSAPGCFNFARALVFASSFLGSIYAEAGLLPATIDFNDDTAGFAPATGGVGQPTVLATLGNSSVVVQESALGIDTKPVVVSAFDNAPPTTGGFAYIFDPIVDNILRVEATLSLDQFMSGFLLRTFGSSPSNVASSVRVVNDGRIQSDSGGGSPFITLGNYSPNNPLRIRTDIDLLAGTWSAIIDEELNGFDDDELIEDLLFFSAPESIASLQGMGGLLNPYSFSNPPSNGAYRVAYDDVWISEIARVPSPSVLALVLWGFLLHYLIARWRTRQVELPA